MNKLVPGQQATLPRRTADRSRTTGRTVTGPGLDQSSAVGRGAGMSAALQSLPRGAGWGESGLRAREPSAKYLAQTEPPIVQMFDLLASAPEGEAKLRELVLSLAVSGRLLAQDPTDKPAHETAAQIRAHREKLVADGLIKQDKALHLEIADDEQPFQLPSTWMWVCLRDVTFSHGQEIPSSQFTYIDVASIDNERGRISPEIQTVAAADAPSRARKLVKPGTVVYSTVRPYLKNVAIIEKDYFPKPIASTAFAVMQPHTGLLSKYLFYYLRSAPFTEFVASRMVGVAYPAINDANFFEGLVPLPPLAEQQRIVARVEELMKLCDTLEQTGRLADEQHARLTSTLFDALAASESARALSENWQRISEHLDLLLDRPEAIDALEQTILQLAVRGLLVPQDGCDETASRFLAKIRSGHSLRDGKADADLTEAPYQVPVGWEWCILETISQVGTGTTPSRTNMLYFDPPEVPWVTSGETEQPFIAATAQAVSALALRETSLKVYPIGTLIVAMYGQGKTRGQISELLIPATTNQACAAIALFEPSEHHRRYIKLFFEKSYDELREQAAGGAQPNLNVGKIKATLIPMPPIAEQQRIVARVEELRQLCVRLRERLTETRETQSLLADSLVAQATATESHTHPLTA